MIALFTIAAALAGAPAPPSEAPRPRAPPRDMPPDGPPPDPGWPPACRDLRAIDWKNHAYPLGGVSDLKDGRAETREYEEIGGLHDTTRWVLRDTTFADLDADGCAEAIVRLRGFHASPRGAWREWTEVWVWHIPEAYATEVAAGHATTAEDTPARIDGSRLIVGSERWRLHDGKLVPAE